MPSRLNYISKKRTDSKNYYRNLKYPEIPLSINDLYITTTVGDRLDSLSYEFLNDVDLWWIITTANPDVIRRDSFNLKPGIEIRIPNNIQGIIEAFEALNK
tara:strand:+ start:184 stop:486 length:303 start_codon:yes stop_codon:yes gene_type:complete